MKTLYQNTIKLIPFILLTVSLQSCIKQPGSWRNDQIPDGKRNDFHKLNEQLLRDLHTGNADDISNMESQEMLDDKSNLRLIELVGNAAKTTDYEIYDEYYIVNKHRSTDTISNLSAGINSYKMTYNGITHEMYFALFLPKDKKFPNQEMITAMYAKYNYGWKLASLNVNTYKINGKTAPELYQSGKAKYDKQLFADARLTLELSLQCNAPNDYWQYQYHAEAGKLFQSAAEATAKQYRFPVVIDGVAGKPRVFRLGNQKNNHGWFPMIYYVTKVNIADTNAVKSENLQIRKVINKLFPGINEDKDYVFYSACSKQPSSSARIEHFDMEDKLR
ncbi:hypothetical protein MTO98_06285 [Mucilaginibacter sp. SMC90]|uniref:hypothetical protein n=1 Tax=Mucilaginibacter sp. SMC90 TaxID=2929803 RepID=UPI001FB309F4|nr:hypothetical protein [Mucilaginibacter sp. SMC90]UOE50681.1 hypothetical protein MTO98_06285 [Mucilaginibacter sp. SMC90]